MTPPNHVALRVHGKRCALVLVHGFSGKMGETWADFHKLLAADGRLGEWDLLSFGYPSSLRVDVRGFWTADPDLALLAAELHTALSLAPFQRYDVLALVAHSMGGLVVQRALLDTSRWLDKVQHVFFFGTPSNGLDKAGAFAWLKPQIRDMDSDGDFIKTLRRDWMARYGENRPFKLRVIAGNRDEFVPHESSLLPFPDDLHEVVPGNHLEIVRPRSADHQSVSIVIDDLTKRGWAPPVAAGKAALAVEVGAYKKAIKDLEPNIATLDADARVTLALAYESTGRPDEALKVIEIGASTTDAMGVLAGRLKRRWLTGRSETDFARARELYADALARAEAAGDPVQAYYHAINVAFLDLMATPRNTTQDPAVAAMADRALGHCAKAPDSQWKSATMGEAMLVKGDLAAAERHYADGIARTASGREIDSMYSQARNVAMRRFGEEGARRIEALFGFG